MKQLLEAHVCLGMVQLSEGCAGQYAKAVSGQHHLLGTSPSGFQIAGTPIHAPNSCLTPLLVCHVVERFVPCLVPLVGPRPEQVWKKIVQPEVRVQLLHSGEMSCQQLQLELVSKQTSNLVPEGLRGHTVTVAAHKSSVVATFPDTP
jgi:hypothetical protein